MHCSGTRDTLKRWFALIFHKHFRFLVMPVSHESEHAKLIMSLIIGWWIPAKALMGRDWQTQGYPDSSNSNFFPSVPPLLLISNSQLFFEASTSVYKISYANLSVPFVYGVRCARLIKIALLLPSRSVSINESLLKASSSRSSVRIRPNQSLRTIYIRDFPPLATHFTVKNSFCDEICSLPRKFQSRDHVWNLLIELPCANPPTPIA